MGLREIDPDPRAPVEPVVDLHQAVDGEAVERGLADARDIGHGDLRQPCRVRGAHVALAQNADDPGRKVGLHQLGVGIGNAEIPERVVASPDKLEFVVHRGRSFNRAVRLPENA